MIIGSGKWEDNILLFIISLWKKIISYLLDLMNKYDMDKLEIIVRINGESFFENKFNIR